MDENVNRLTPSETERLAILSEECAEVIHIIGKVLRHGYESSHPDGGPTNRELLAKECGDVRHAMDIMTDNTDISLREVLSWRKKKAESIKKYLRHQ